MQTLLDVVNVEARDDYSLVLTFENGAKRRFDMKPLLEKRPFLRLKVGALFKKASVGLALIHDALRHYVRLKSRKDLTELAGKVKFVEDFDHKKMRKLRP